MTTFEKITFFIWLVLRILLAAIVISVIFIEFKKYRRERNL